MKFTAVHEAVDVFRESKDPRAFRYIYDSLSGKLYYVCLRYLKTADAQDVLQESFVTAYHKMDSFSGQGSFEGWMRRIVVNNCLSKLRVDQKTFAFNGEFREEAHDQAEDEPAIDQEATEAKLMAALHALPTGYRTILNLAVLEDYSHREIGELLGISESTSRSQLTRAKAALKEKLERS